MSINVDVVDLPGAPPRPTEDDGVGCLHTGRGNLPLELIDVRAAITGLASSIQLTQGFRNPHDEPLEATYIFPLPPRAAVTALRMEADGRVVEGVLKERAEAREEYDQAIDSGKRASIAEEERPGVFTMRVGNIMPGEKVSVHLTLAGALSYEDGEATFRFPLVVAPRYIPGVPLADGQVGEGVAPDTDQVPDASRISPPVLLPGFPNPVQLSVEVDVDPGSLPLQGISSSLHATATEDAPTGLRVRLNPGERADRDFLLRLRYGSEAISTSMSVLPDGEDGGTFALTVLPPALETPVRGRDVVLVLDRSGSMGGWKMVAARRAAARIVDTLGSGDRFTVLAFDHQVETPTSLPTNGLVEADDRNRFRAVEFLSGLDARGGTEMLTPLRQAAELLREATDRDRVLVLVTDGQIGNEDQLLRELATGLDGVRVHTVGIDRAVNEAFLQRLAGSSGRYELVESEERLDDAMQHIHRRIGSPVVTGLAVTASGLAVDTATMSPTPLPDLFTGAPVVITGRFTGAAEGAVTVTSDGEWESKVVATPSDNPSLAALWARARIRDLEDRYVIGTGDGASLEKQIVDTSLKHGVLSRFTAFVAIDQRVVNEGGKVHRVTQPVDLPSGWEPPAIQPSGGFAPGAAIAQSMPMFGAAPAALGGGGLGARSRMPAPGDGRGRRVQAHRIRPPQPPLSKPAPSPMAESSEVAGDSAIQPLPAPPAVDCGPADSLIPPVVPPATSLTDFVAQELASLKSAAGENVWTRAGLLSALSERIRVQLGPWEATGEPQPARLTLGNLAARLATPTADPAEVDARWHQAITTLESLTTPSLTNPTRKPFWKR